MAFLKARYNMKKVMMIIAVMTLGIFTVSNASAEGELTFKYEFGKLCHKKGKGCSVTVVVKVPVFAFENNGGQVIVTTDKHNIEDAGTVMDAFSGEIVDEEGNTYIINFPSQELIWSDEDNGFIMECTL